MDEVLDKNILSNDVHKSMYKRRQQWISVRGGYEHESIMERSVGTYVGIKM